MFKDEKKILDYCEYYALLRKLSRGESRSCSEFRRNVKTIIKVDGKEVELNIDILGDYFYKTVKFLEIVKDRIK